MQLFFLSFVNFLGQQESKRLYVYQYLYYLESA